ncbi:MULTISPECIES: transposase [Halococcaceae]|uniref:Transposase IS4 family protein n=1 Tax=Halalkalicoccus jeotgali (strain DSM 18796 / CECT 7217 / JCM 14584 / KCTC 4019 / B3) TaxID=795797 RepID=D8JAX6_HALJB|nr:MULTISPECIES: transposase [Halococcaceae]ADJ16429.1 transposase IS4 family protein [Halalkalicoccus jeotgali B3]ADJ17153.1 transposase IS4 family protein [Halalkalicoccus jeotgali B3]ELY41152.1 transposase IS4 family protein [Halalkalicoccus jeotgali B3]
MVAAALVADATGYNGRSRFFEDDPDGTGDALDGFVADVTTIAQSQCERAGSYTDIETLVCHLPIDHLTFAAQDSLAPYSGRYPMAIHVRATLLMEINGWDETALHDHLRTHPSLRQNLGFETLPNQSTFWRAWNERFSEKLRDAVRECADSIVRAARACGVSLPDRIDIDEADESDADDPPERQLVAAKTDEVWQQAKPFVTDAFALSRGPNWQIHENAFWEQHAYMGMREDMYARSGPASFSLDTTRERIPTGSTHRYQIGKLSVAEIRSMLRNTTRMLIARARQNGELDGPVFAAIDVTKGFPFTGDLEDHDDDILGYKDGNDYYQWAVLKIVGMDVPLVLDAIPRVRGQSKDEIVEKLLSQTTEMVDIDLVMMDREFDSGPVKDTCEEYGVHFLNPTRIFERSDEAETIAWMYRNGKRFHVTEEETLEGTSTRKQIYLPQRSNSDDDEDDSLSEVWTEMCGEWEFENVDGEPSEGMSFSRLLADIQREEEVEERKQKAKDGDVDTAETVVFETNHPYVTARGTDDQRMEGKEFIHMIERLIRWYRRRWGIENGFKKQKHFMVRTTSTERDYRFFNFAFACVLYNVWRLVDLLVKIAIDGEDLTYKPRVDANQFLTVAKQYYGLDPPD